MKYHKDNGLPYFDFLDIKIRKQGKIVHEGIDYIIDYDNMSITFKNANNYYTYKIIVCVNVEYINDFIKQTLNLQ